MLKECTSCQSSFETSGETVIKCPACNRSYRMAIGLQKPEGWERKTADLKSYASEYNKKYREKNLEEIKAKDRARSKGRIYTPEQNNRKRELKMKKKYGEGWTPYYDQMSGVDNLVKKIARAKFKDAVRRGKIKKHLCWVCGEADAEGHHADYSKPLDVIWLCRKHHKEVHSYKTILATSC